MRRAVTAAEPASAVGHAGSTLKHALARAQSVSAAASTPTNTNQHQPTQMGLLSWGVCICRNHESHIITQVYGFAAELKAKYGKTAKVSAAQMLGWLLPASLLFCWTSQGLSSVSLCREATSQVVVYVPLAQLA